MLAWLDTDDARRQAGRLARRRGLSGYDALVDNLLAEARVAVWHRLRSEVPLRVERPGAYGTLVIRSVVRQVAQGREGTVELVDGCAPEQRQDDPALARVSGDDVRVHLERLGDNRPWVTSAALSYLTLLMDPSARPPGAPWPKAGSNEAQARCWPALWFAGERAVFDDADAADAAGAARLRRTRSRRIAVVLERVERALALHALELLSSSRDDADG